MPVRRVPPPFLLTNTPSQPLSRLMKSTPLICPLSQTIENTLRALKIERAVLKELHWVHPNHLYTHKYTYTSVLVCVNQRL